MRVGDAWLEITPDRPLPLQGQMHRRLPHHTRDPLTVNAVAFDDGATRLVLVSCDLIMMTDETTRAIQAECARRTGINPNHVIIGCTHTHVGPCMLDALNDTADRDYLAWLEGRVADAVQQAVADLEPAELYTAEGYLEQLGWNRRGLRADGSVSMYWGSWREGFAGLEGPRDGQLPVVWARRPDGSVKAIVTGFATHPNCCESEHFYSADMVGAMRSSIRRLLGERVGVAYFTGAAANTSPRIMEENPHNVQPWRGEDGLERSGAYLAAEVVKTVLGHTRPMENPKLSVAQAALELPLRAWDFDVEAHTRPGPMRDYYTTCQQMWPQLVAQGPAKVRLSVVRLGDAAICTNPAELYVELGLAIKQTSPARVTMIAQLTDGYCGYVPTRGAFERGGYSTWPAVTSKLCHEAGDRIVEATTRLLKEQFAPATFEVI